VLWPERATIGGILAANESGALRLRYGGLRDLIIGVTLALADGTLARSGGKVVKNVAGYDLPKLATGALGTLGVITQAIFRLHPLPQQTRTLTISARSVDDAQRLLHALHDSTLAHAALQARLAGDATPDFDVLLEGTAAGIAAQEAMITELAAPAHVAEGANEAWLARQSLWSSPEGSAIAKLSILPANLAPTVATINRLAIGASVGWRAVMQATGIGWLRFDGAPEKLTALLLELRADVAAAGGSLVIAQQPIGAERIDAWGDPGDALPLMRATKQQLDPHSTLNPGRFVGGI
jgi:glycolate oxidase FAD binding subunit